MSHAKVLRQSIRFAILASNPNTICFSSAALHLFCNSARGVSITFRKAEENDLPPTNWEQIAELAHQIHSLSSLLEALQSSQEIHLIVTGLLFWDCHDCSHLVSYNILAFRPASVPRNVPLFMPGSRYAGRSISLFERDTRLYFNKIFIISWLYSQFVTLSLVNHNSFFFLLLPYLFFFSAF